MSTAAVTSWDIAKFERGSAPPFLDMVVASVLRTLADASLTPRQIDGIITIQSNFAGPAFNVTLAEVLGIYPTYSLDITTYGASPTVALWHAKMAIESKLAKRVIIVGGDLTYQEMRRQSQRRPPSIAILDEFELPYGSHMANSDYAMIAELHKNLYGTTDEMRAKVVVDQRRSAALNERALFRDPIDIDDVLKSRLVSSPLHLLECVATASGASSLLVTELAEAKEITFGNPVTVEGFGFSQSGFTLSNSQLLTNGLVSGVARAGEGALAMANISIAEVDIFGIYDCYPIAVMIALEDLGITSKGEIGPWVLENDLTLGGKVPVNTSGGQLSNGQIGDAGGMVNLLEVIERLAGTIPLDDGRCFDLGVVTSNGGPAMSCESVVVLKADK
jgi:acetyl-CoA acetyltransferase